MTKKTTFALCTGLVAVCMAGESIKKDSRAPLAPVNSLKIGDSYEDAVKILSAVGLKPEERFYSIIRAKDTEDRYVPLTENAAIAVLFDVNSHKISGLSLMTSPSHTPVKGLEVYMPVDRVTFDGDRHYTLVFPREQKPAK